MLHSSSTGLPGIIPKISKEDAVQNTLQRPFCMAAGCTVALWIALLISRNVHTVPWPGKLQRMGPVTDGLPTHFYRLDRYWATNYHPPMKLSEDNVCLFTQWAPCDYYPWWIGSHHTGNPNPTSPSPNPTQALPALPALPLVLTSGGQAWRPVQTCSLEDPPC